MDSLDFRNDSCANSDFQKVTVRDAAKELGIDPGTLRSWMKHNVIKIGIADRKDGKERWSFTIYRSWLDKFKERECTELK
jgi:transposase-like protein